MTHTFAEICRAVSTESRPRNGVRYHYVHLAICLLNLYLYSNTPGYPRKEGYAGPSNSMRYTWNNDGEKALLSVLVYGANSSLFTTMVYG